MSVGHPICCRKATAQILFLGYAPYPFQNFNSGLENTPLPHVCSGKKKAPAIADVAKTYSGVYGIHLIPPVAPFHTCIMDAAIPPFNHYARFWCRFAEHGQRGKCLVRSPILGASWSCKMGGWYFVLTRFLHFLAYAVYIMPYNVNNIGPFLQVCSHFLASFRTFHGFLRDTPGPLWLAVGVQWGAGGDFADCFRLNRAKPGTLSPRGCCGVL